MVNTYKLQFLLEWMFTIEKLNIIQTFYYFRFFFFVYFVLNEILFIHLFTISIQFINTPPYFGGVGVGVS